jgi:hypothetical protein
METFVVRIWVPAEAADARLSELHGVVEHIGSGRSRRFAGSTQLISFIEYERRAGTWMRDESRKGNSHEA